MKLTDKKQINKLAYLCAFIYFVSYITRINYGAVVSEMVTSTGLAKSTLSMALTGSFITYGAGQLISGYFGDRFQPKYLISLGLLISVLMNLLIPICNNNVQMTAVWCVNGLAQAFMWPPIVKLTSGLLSAEDYNKTCVIVSRGSSVGTIFIYLAAPVIISLFSWESVFFMCAALGIIGLVIWYKTCPEIELTFSVDNTIKNKTAGVSKIFAPLVVLIMVVIVLQGILRDGITTWMPSFISETYNLSNEISILTGVLLPVFSIVCYQITLWLYSKTMKSPLLCAMMIFGVGAICSVLLYAFYQVNAAFSIFLMTLLAGCMHGVNMILVCIVPPLLSKNGKVSTISGLLNSCTYVGSAVSAYLIPLAAENAGWSATMLIWLLAAVVGTAICFICIPICKKKI